tara:strand:+ start:22 stop:387 length:366 start_codon:yes stop_codon:yes gene_type:complete
MITINFVGNVNTILTSNNSMQIGDMAYYVLPPNTLGGFLERGQDTPILIGNIVLFGADWIRVDNALTGIVPPQGAFIMFGKDSSINISGLTGYFAEVEIKNNSKEKAEMYCIASGISPSSK